MDYEQFFLVFQTVIDAMDPINWSAEAVRYNNVVLHEVIGDTVTPNFVPTAPLSGTEPMIRAMGLTAYSSTQSDPAGLDLAGRFVPPASHGSFATPATSPEATAEMQQQFASFIATRGTTVVVTNESTMVTVAASASDTPPDNSKKFRKFKPGPALGLAPPPKPVSFPSKGSVSFPGKISGPIPGMGSSSSPGSGAEPLPGKDISPVRQGEISNE